MEQTLSDAAQFADLGTAGIFAALVLWIIKCFGDDVHAWVKSLPDRKSRRDQLIENNTEAFHLVRAALDNNSAVLQLLQTERDTHEALLREHDAKSQIHFDHVSESLNRIEGRMH